MIVKYKGWDIVVKHKDCTARSNFEFGQTTFGVVAGEQPKLGCYGLGSYKCNNCEVRE